MHITRLAPVIVGALFTSFVAAIPTTGAQASGSQHPPPATVVLPPGAAEHAADVIDRYELDSPWQRALDAAINPDDYECGATDLNRWIDQNVAAIDPATMAVLDGFIVDLWPAVYTVLFDNDASDEYQGVDGEYTRELIKRHRDNRRFWDVRSDDILLMGMHGAVIADDAKMVPVVQFLFGVDTATARFVVDLVQDVFAGDDSFDLDNPLLTLNAFAFSTGGEPVPGIGMVPDKIIMGEGILEAEVELGLGDIGPSAIHAHEFAHHVQFEIGAFESDLPEPEATRRTELMADAFSSYYLGHARGATFQTKRIVDAFQTFFDVGDCGFDSPGHHGTPNQRRAASEWGAGLASSAKKQGHINGSLLMLQLFDAQLPILVAPDAP